MAFADFRHQGRRDAKRRRGDVIDPAEVRCSVTRQRPRWADPHQIFLRAHGLRIAHRWGHYRSNCSGRSGSSRSREQLDRAYSIGFGCLGYVILRKPVPSRIRASTASRAASATPGSQRLQRNRWRCEPHRAPRCRTAMKYSASPNAGLSAVKVIGGIGYPSRQQPGCIEGFSAGSPSREPREEIRPTDKAPIIRWLEAGTVYGVCGGLSSGPRGL